MIQQLTESINQIAIQFGLSDLDLPLISPRVLSDRDLTADCLLIRGENLTALAMMVEGLAARVQFCYIDPPYNTGGKFVYHDRRQKSSHPVWGKHTEWMAFMLPRLVLARALLSDEGIIAISIDDYEYAQLKVLTDAIFSPECHIATLVVRRSNNGKGGKPNVSVNHEYVVLYGKSVNAKLRGLPENDDEKYDKCDEYGNFRIDGLFRKKGAGSLREDRPAMYYPLYCSENGRVSVERNSDTLMEVYPQDSSGTARRWLWGREKAAAEAWKLYASKSGVVYVKNYNTEGKRVKMRSIIDKLDYLTERATNEAKEIFGEGVFETPKPLTLIRDLVDCCSSEDGIILDFFAGTGTTAHAAFDLAHREPKKRKTILVEHKHQIESGHAASRAGYETTADITEQRLKFLCANDPAYSYQVIDV